MRNLALICASLMVTACAQAPSPPTVEQRPVETTHFGHTRTDPYGWLRDLDDPAVMEQLKQENAYTDAVLQPLQPLQAALHAEMLKRVPEQEIWPPEPDGNWEYYDREDAALDYPVYLRKPLGGGEEQVVLDLNLLAAGHTYYRIPEHQVSPDGSFVAYLEDTDGDDVAALRVRAIDGTSDQQIHPEELSAYALAWSREASHLFYARPDETQRSSEIWRHTLGADPSSDVMLLREEDGRFWYDITPSRSGDMIFFHAVADDASRIHALDANHPLAAPQEIIPHSAGLRVTEICHRRSDTHKGWFYSVDNGGGALDGRLTRRRVDAAPGAPWEVVQPELPGVQIRTFAIIRDWLVFEERREGQRVVRVVRHDGSDEHVVPLNPSPGFASFDLGPEYDRETIRVVTSGLNSSFSLYEYDPRERSHQTLFTREPAIDPSRYSAGVIFGTADDGTQIPVSYVRPVDAPVDGSAPAVLTGYGAVGVIYEPGERFAREYASLLERGFTVAIAHPRGGGFHGKRWHNAARLEAHALTFSDFAAAADGLFEAGFAAPDRLALVGGSAGGLLVGAAINLRPDLARVVVAQVPFVDCLNSMLDPTLPATTLDYPEYGNPEEERYYRSILSFAPYENVREADYPDILATGGITDARVAFWEPAKWVARLRERRTDAEGLTLLRMNLGAGHEGASGRTDALEARAEWQAFVLDRIGLQ